MRQIRPPLLLQCEYRSFIRGGRVSASQPV